MRSGLLVGVITLAACKWQPHKDGAGSGSSRIESAGSAAADSNGWIVDQLPGERPAVLALDGASSTDVWAVGENLLVHFDGKGWSDVAPQGLRCRGCQLNSISVAAADDVWAVGNDGLVAHYDGRSWTTMQPEILRVKSGVSDHEDLAHVVAWRGHGLVASIQASKELVRFDGATWSKLPSLDGGWADVFWGNAPNDLWVWDRTSSSRFDMSMRHFDGNAWGHEVQITSGPEIRQLDGSGPQDIWMIGGWGGRSQTAVLYHYDGKDWTEVKPADYTTGMRSIDVLSPSEAYAAATHSLLVWNGTDWKTLPGPLALTNFDKVYAPGGGHLFVAAWEDGRVAHK